MDAKKRDFWGLLGVVAIFAVSLCILPNNGFLGVFVLLVSVFVGLSMMRKKRGEQTKQVVELESKVKIDEKIALKLLREYGVKTTAEELISVLSGAAKERRILGTTTTDDYLFAMRKILREHGKDLVKSDNDKGFEVKELEDE